MGNDDNGEYLNNIIISFKDKTKKINCNPKMTFEEIIKKFLQEHLNNQYDLEKLTLMINGVICYPDETLESYKNYKAPIQFLNYIIQKIYKIMIMIIIVIMAG